MLCSCQANYSAGKAEQELAKWKHTPLTDDWLPSKASSCSHCSTPMTTLPLTAAGGSWRLTEWSADSPIDHQLIAWSACLAWSAWLACSSWSEQLLTEGGLETDMLCTLDRKSVHCVVIHLKQRNQLRKCFLLRPNANGPIEDKVFF